MRETTERQEINEKKKQTNISLLQFQRPRGFPVVKGEDR